MNILIAGIPGHTRNYENALARCNVSFETSLSPADLFTFDRLLLPGGGDIHPSWFGQGGQGSSAPDPELDRAQFCLLHTFVLQRKPVLGICRGMQMINVYFGGDLIQDLATADTHRYDGQDQVHTADTVSGSFLSGLYANPCLVNSAHHQGCGLTGRELMVTQTAADGVTEALEHKALPVLGVQWHPERTGLSPRQADLADGMLLIHHFAERL